MKKEIKKISPWTQEEIDMLMGYVFADDSETINERLDFARYMLHYESGCGFSSRSLSAVRKKYYENIREARKSIKNIAE